MSFWKEEYVAAITKRVSGWCNEINREAEDGLELMKSGELR